MLIQSFTQYANKYNTHKTKSEQNVVTEMYVSWPVPRGKSSNAAPQGNGI